MMNNSSLRTTINFLRRDPVYDLVSLYKSGYHDAKQPLSANSNLEEKDIMIRNVRGTESSLSTTGFVCMKLDSNLTAKDFDHTSNIIEVYLPELSRAVQVLLGADRVQIYDFTRRKRHPEYPYVKGDEDVDNIRQPANSAHIDEVHRDVLRIMEKLNPDEFHTLSKQRWQAVIAWKPLRGPVRDWPLAVCDMRTVNPNTDLHLRDLQDPDRVSDEYILHYSPEQKWYYLQDQMPNEAWLMLQTDSSGRTGVPHSGFPNPESGGNAPLRESIDVTMLVYYKD